MIVGIMQPYFFPYLGYWQLLNAVDKYVVYDDVTYIKGGWINRNNILLNNQKYLITLPLEKASSFKIINEIAITNNVKQRTRICKTIEAAYKKAPYYSYINPLVESLIMDSHTIAELNYKAILVIAEYVGINTEIILSSELDKDNGLKGQDKVIHINTIIGADTYYNAIGGKELYDRMAFEQNGINLLFLKMNPVEYKQYDNVFVPGLSILDVLMFNSPEEIHGLLADYTLIEA